ncbi:OFA family MFS transporter [Halorubrum distributum]|uniref:Major facilitator superfamily MFS_1 n=1 Tax=Halorubrum distributum JCM 10247 TaxID=1227486 RepID=M0D642_9EURY|nr:MULTISPECIES: OFA family MFS transporter [Halorubrum distributum group]ELZ30152.1 major facilitator superfamily MFS_1 [Halorubrum terrestre JCM 10247]MDV7348796.1 OFA family MFS transporter [Halorubrum distributum]
MGNDEPDASTAETDGETAETDGETGDNSAVGIDYAARAADVLGFSRWWQIAAAAGMMAAVSPYQYVWSSISPALSEGLDIALPALGAVFSFYVVFQSLSQFPAGKWRDSRGPGALTFLAAVLAGGGYIGLAYATSLWQLYLLYSLGAVGVGIVYTVAVNTAVKWFPDRTGLTTGVGTMAFAAGSALVVPYVRANATVAAYSDVLRNIGIGILVVTLVGSFLLRDPPEDWLDRKDGDDDDEGLAASIRGRNYSTREMLSTWQFWLLYAMFIAMASADLLVIANVVRFAENFGLAALIATLSATLLPVAAGVSRLILGEATDRFDRKRVMAGSFLLAGLFRIGLVGAGEASNGAVFVAFVLGAMFFSSPLYVFFPSLLADYYGAANSSGNYAVLYTAKVGGGVFSGVVAGYLVASTGWNATFVLGGGLAVAAGLATFVLRPPSGSGLESPEASRERPN